MMVKLPVVVLGMVRNPNWGFGFLLVTDFTDLHCSLYNRNVSVPVSLRQDISVGGKKLRDSQIMSISIKADALDGIWNSLAGFSPKLAAYNYTDENLGMFPSEGVIANVSFRAKTFRGCVDGLLSYVRVATRATLGLPSIAKEFDAKLGNLMLRYAEYMDPPLYNRLLPVFPVEKYMRYPGAKRVKTDYGVELRAQMERARAQVERRPQPAAPRSSRTGGTSALPPASRAPPTAPTAPALAPASGPSSAPPATGKPLTARAPQSSSSAPAPAAAVPTVVAPASSRSPATEAAGEPMHRSASLAPPAPSTLSLTARGHTADAPFASWCALEPAVVAEGARFRVRARIASLDPDGRVFVKPFRRTLKLAPLRLVMTDQSSLSSRACAEISLESEWCAFLAMDEIEESLAQLLHLSALIQLLPGRDVLLVVERRLFSFDFGYSRPYWGLVSTLNDLVQT